MKDKKLQARRWKRKNDFGVTCNARKSKWRKPRWRRIYNRREKK